MTGISSSMIGFPDLWLLATAVVCSLLFWRLWPMERRRIYAAWVLIGLDLTCTRLGSSINTHWLNEVGRALGELALVQFAMILIVQIVRRWTMHIIWSELVTVVAYIFVSFRLLSRLGTDVNGLIATSTVVTAIIGLSMQDMLVNSVSGMVLQFENELGQGDFVETEKGSGWIRRVRTRYTAIETPDSDVLLVPNHVLTRNTVKLATASRRTLVQFQLDYEHLPTRVTEEVDAVLRSSLIEGIAKNPGPTCFVRSLNPGYVEYGVYIWVTTPGHEQRQISEVLTRIVFGLARAGMPMSAVSQKVQLENQLPRSTAQLDQQVSRTVLEGSDIFRTLTETELTFLTERLRPASFAPREKIVSQGDEGDSVYIVIRGKLGVWLTAEDGRSEQVAMLHPGSFFGEMSLLTGEPRSASVIAIDQVDCQRLDRSDFAQILEQRPELAREISDIVIERQSTLSRTRERLNSTTLVDERQTLVARIQSVFRMQRKSAKNATRAS